MKNNKGFTLIELLVVVLIIGILAAIALPQYFKAVEKSRAAEANTILGAVNHAQAVYRMGAQNAYTDDFAALDIDLPTTAAVSGATYETTNFTYTLSGTTTAAAEIQALRKPGKYTIALRFVDGKRKCTDGTDTICASMGLTNAYPNN